MKKGFKRIVAMLCAVAMIVGGCFVDGGNISKASDTAGQKEWTIVSQVGDITSTENHVGEIYRRWSNLNLQLNADKTEDDYMLYIKVYLQDDYAKTSMMNTYVELANESDGNGELCWLPAYWGNNGIETTTGVNELYLPLNKFADSNAEGNSNFDVAKTIKYLRIRSAGVTDCTGVILDEVKIIDVTPVVQEYTGAKATVTPTENIPDGYVFAGWYKNKACTSVLSGETTGKAYAKFVKEEVLSLKTQYAMHKGPQMLADCDSTDGLSFQSGATAEITSVEGEFVEGEGAFKRAETSGNSRLWIWLDKAADVSKYKDSGYLHFWFNVNDPTLINKGLIIDIGPDQSNMFRWTIAKENLVSGWNEVYLPFAKGYTAVGTVDFSKISMIKISQYSGTTNTMTTIVDDIRLVDAIPDLKITDCDSVEGLTLRTGSVTTALGQYKEGSGAFIRADQDAGANIRMQFTLSEPMNLTAYTDESICFSFYITDPTLLPSYLIVDFGNDSLFNTSSTYYRWAIPKGNLQNGWNEICLAISKATSVVPEGQTVDITKMTDFRILQGGSSWKVMTTIVDNIRIEATQPGLEIADCDSTEGVTLSVGTVTTTLGQYKEGSGAYILANAAANVRVRFTLSKAMNLSEYTDGSLHFKIYIDNPTSLERGILVDFGNNSAFSGNYYRWVITEDKLQSGWNEICLSLSSATTPVSAPDITKMTDFRILQYSASSYTAMTTIVDDIRIEKEEVHVNTYADLRFVTTVDSINYANVGFEITIGKKTSDKYSNKVYGTLHGVSGDETITYTPDVFTIESKYFKAHTLTNIPETAFDTEIKLRPFWTTQDGTKVFGTQKTCTVNGEIAANENVTPETDLRVVFSSDIHYTAYKPDDYENAYHGINPDTRMQYWVDCITAEHQKDNIDLLILNGDFSLDYTLMKSGLLPDWVVVANEKDMTQKFINTYLKQITDLGIEVFVMPGNHELYADSTWLTMTGNNRQGFKVVGNNLFICLDNYNNTSNPPETIKSDGNYTNTDTQYINQLMQEYPNHDVYLVAHNFELYKQDGQTVSDTGLQQLLATDTDNRIKALIDGHGHEAAVRKLGQDWNNKISVRTGNFSYSLTVSENLVRFWGFRELIITEDSAYSQYINVKNADGCNVEGGHKRTTSDAVWFY